METIAQRLKRLRKVRGMSQRELATKRVSYAYISRIEHGQRSPSLKAVRELAAKLGVTPLYLETGQEATCPHCGRTAIPVTLEEEEGFYLALKTPLESSRLP